MNIEQIAKDNGVEVRRPEIYYTEYVASPIALQAFAKAIIKAYVAEKKQVIWINAMESGEYDTVYQCPKCSRKYSVQAEDTRNRMECHCGFEAPLYALKGE